MFNLEFGGDGVVKFGFFQNENSKPDFLNTVNDVSNGSDKTKPKP